MSAISYSQFQRDYHIRKPALGEGVTGRVYEITKKKTGEKFALKVADCNDISQLNTSLAQAEIMARIDHQCIPKMYYHFLKQDTAQITQMIILNKYTQDQEKRKRKVPTRFYFGIVMEYCQRSLKQEIMEIGAGKMKPYTLEELWDFIRSMASVLSKMQKMNILHRDIKPENILIKIEGNSKRKWKLCDFAFSTVKNQYSGHSITGTEEYVSPRVLKKFKNNHLVIEGINAKDDIYSLGKTILQLITQKSHYNHGIDSKYISKIARSYNSNNLYNILTGILEYQQKDRWDFVKLDYQIQRIDKLMGQKCIDLDGSMVQEYSCNGYGQQSMESYVKDKNREKTHNAEVQVNILLQHNLASQQKISHNCSMKKNHQYQLNQTYYEPEPQSSQNPQHNQTSPVLSQISHVNPLPLPQKTLYLHQNILSTKHKINCMHKFQDWMLFGLTQAIGFCPLDGPQKAFFILQFRNFHQKGKPKFNVTSFISVKNTIAIVGTGDFFIYYFTESLSSALYQITHNKDLLIKEGVLKKVSPGKKGFFKEAYSACHDDVMLYETTMKSFDTRTSYSMISCLGVMDYEFKGVETPVFLGHYDGSVEMLNGDKIYKGEQNAAIRMIKSVEKDVIVFNDVDGKIIKMRTVSNPDKGQTYEFKMYKAQNPIVSFELLPKIQPNDDLSYIPYVQLYTMSGQKVILSTDFQVISIQNLNKNIQITQVFTSPWNWTIKAQSQGSSQHTITKHLHTQENSMTTYYTDTRGRLFSSKSNRVLYDFGMKGVSAVHVDQDLIVVANFDGQIKVLYTHEARRQLKEGEQSRQIESGEIVVRNGIKCQIEVKKECKKEYDEKSDDENSNVSENGSSEDSSRQKTVRFSEVMKKSNRNMVKN